MCDWEAELAVVIGSPARRVPASRALDAVAGYAVMNDISMRNFQRHTSQFLPGKTFERSTPVGPWIVPAADVDDARDLRIRCLVNGEVRQEASTSEMIFSVADVIAYVSSFITLVPGDMIAMGTPQGIGAARTPPVFLRDGDIVVTEVEGIGTLRNRCRIEPVTATERRVDDRMAGAER
jgi:acylpyruvate hydrolase